MTDALLGLPLPDAGLEASLSRGLLEVEDGLREAVASDDPFVADASRYLVDAGGKRFRPLLVLLAAQFGNPAAVGVVPAGVVVELTHLATLYHDDVMDEAKLRRGAESANARRSSKILADLGPEAVRIQAATFERLCKGQIRETVGPREGQDPIEHHLEVVADKTGSLIAASGRYGALMAQASDDHIELLTAFGERIGVAFQLADDLVDITSESMQSGKTPGTDLREGIPTLAGLYALASSDPADVRLQELLSRPLPDDDEHAEALALMRRHPGVVRAREEARAWSDSARELLDGLPEQPARDVLALLCDYVVSRTG
jgi:heptaprenyl diphosphate synthase